MIHQERLNKQEQCILIQIGNSEPVCSSISGFVIQILGLIVEFKESEKHVLGYIRGNLTDLSNYHVCNIYPSKKVLSPPYFSGQSRKF